MRARLILLALSTLLLAGCGGDGGGGGGCITTANVSPNPSYAGFYAATYTPRAGAVGGSLEFSLNVATDGMVTGKVHNPSISPEFDADVTGSILGTNDACGTGQTYVELRYTFAGGEPQTLDAQRNTSATIDATFSVRGIVDGSERTLGSLKVEPLATTE